MNTKPETVWSTGYCDECDRFGKIAVDTGRRTKCQACIDYENSPEFEADEHAFLVRQWEDAVAAGEEWALKHPVEWHFEVVSARQAREGNYGSPSYWQYLDASARESYDYFMTKGDPEKAKEMLTRSLSDALRGNDGA